MTRPKGRESSGLGLARRRLLGAAALGICSLAAGTVTRAATTRLDQPGTVVMLRHALAPGVGDPPGFVLENCATQRNLDARGRDQARAIGARLRDAGLADTAVHSSRWCRCLETAELLALGPVVPLPALDSFFRDPGERDSRTAALRAFLADAGADGPPLVLVTHQVNISGLVGCCTRSGEGVILDRGPNGTVAERAALPPPPV